MAASFKIPLQPDWFRVAADDASFTVTDVYRLFGYSGSAGLYKSIHRGGFPEADCSRIKTFGFGKRQVQAWSKKVLLTEYNRRLRLINERGKTNAAE